MRFFLTILALFCLTLSGVEALAESVAPDAGQLLVPPPMMEPPSPDGSRCFVVHNNAVYTIVGSVITNYYTNMVGQKSHGTSNFRLAPGAKKQFCTSGPYFPGTRIGITLRTIVPTFSCYTAAQGTIEIHGEINAEGHTRSWVDCQ